MLKTCMANPRTNVNVQIMKVGIISLHIFEHPSSLKGWVIHEKMIMSPSTIATIPKMACNQTRDNWKSDKLLINIKSPMKTGIIIQSVVAMFNPIAATGIIFRGEILFFGHMADSIKSGIVIDISINM